MYHQEKTTITYHLKKYHDTIYITIFYTINISMKFVCLLHESKLQVIELTEYEGTDTSIRHIIYINYSDTYLHQIATTGSTKYKACKSVTKI